MAKCNTNGKQLQITKILPNFPMNDSYCTTSNQISPQYSYASLVSTPRAQGCMFCEQVNLIRCMSISLFNKHNEEPSFELNITSKLVEQSATPVNNKFQELLKHIDRQERMTRYYPKDYRKVQTHQLLEYYKYRKFVPLFPDSTTGKLLHTYYYNRLKLYYNQIKKQLNLTVDPSSDTDFSSSNSLSISQNISKSKILYQITQNAKIQQTTGSTINNFKTQSKALEDLLSYLKSHERFNQLQPFNGQSQLKNIKKTSKEIFKDIILHEKNDNKSFIKNKNKIFINFYSRSGSIPKDTQNKNTFKVLKSQNLVKMKTVKPIEKANENKIFHKLERIKDELLEYKVKQIINYKNQEKQKKTTINQNQQSDIKNSIRLHENPRKQNGSKQKNSAQKLILDTRKRVINTPQREVKKKSFEVKKSHSESKLKSTTVSLQKNKSLRIIPNKNLQKFVNGQRIVLQKQYTPQKQPNNKTLESARPLSRRKSLDLAKLKSFFSQTQNKRINNIERKQDFLSHKYQNLLLQTPKRFTKTTNVTPINTKRQKDINQVILEKTDNIVSMKKKKLELLKKKMQLQKIEKK